MTPSKRRNLSQRSELLEGLHEYNINPDTREIFLHGQLDDNPTEEPGVDYRMAVTFEKNVSYLNGVNNEPILLHMHTVGGDWNDGIAIYDTIKTSRSPIVILAYAHARSMSSIIFQAAADRCRVLMPNSEVLIHHGTFGIDTNYCSAESEFEQGKKATKIMLDIYVDRCQHGLKYKGKTLKYIKNDLDKRMRMKQELYLTGREAIEHGLADAIIGDEGYENITALRADFVS